MQRAGAVCSAGQGFGSAPQRKPSGKASKGAKQKGVSPADSKAVQRAVRLVEEQEGKQAARGPAGVRPVDPREASRGRVEFVKVKDWGGGAPEDLGGLQLESGATPVFEAGGADAADAPSTSGRGSDGGGSSSGGGSNGGMPFHEVLARRLELLQSRGALGGLAQAPGGTPLPPFDRWAFAAEHYAQYLSDMHSVHAALEQSLAAAADAQRQAAAPAAPADRQRRERLLAALELFGSQAGLARSAALLQDLQQFTTASGAGQQQQQQQAGGGQGPAAASQHAAAYAAYIASLARLCAAADGPEEEEQALLRLLANAYVAYLQHLTSGGRVGAAAAQRLGLAQAGALSFYSDYPRLPAGARPLERFVGAANQLGALLSAGQQEALMQELAKAMNKSSQLLLALAREA